jgi:uncharacterized small protein (DUF1192 family)
MCTVLFLYILILLFNNKAWQVKVLDEASKTTVEENQRLVMSVDELESRLQTLEAKIALTEASMTKEVSFCRASPLVIVMFGHLIFCEPTTEYLHLQ